MDQHRIDRLERWLLKKLDGSITPEEEQQLSLWMDEHPANRQLADAFADNDWLSAQLSELERIPVPRPVAPVHRVHFMRRWGWAAAAILLLGGTATYIWLKPAQKAAPDLAVTTIQDVLPGREGAILTLDNGEQVLLDSLPDGEVARQGGSRIRLLKGQLAYDEQSGKADAVRFNTVNTPRGRQFSLLLPDGTRVWLNSATMIKFPVAFTGAERRVEVSGEAYFEVAKNDAQPFTVQVNQSSEIKVLGTRFNIKAYLDEKIASTTLLDGKVSVTGNDEPVVLRPGQQANLGNGQLQVVQNAHVDAVMAWKNGLFNFEDRKLEDVMRELARWYDLDIVYEGKVPDITLGGEMSRNEPLSGVLIGLEELKIKFRMEAGRRLVILP
ncbi:FecR domain-containing protein [Chitinophaga horti]|uniref:FecR domain-containing protein n=1 Tax=Chitinophaga horti TaxID=2920382 RepID=A0ABY6JBH5_9BACT|nr:FecR family protein [Chitinophaga horti]UYQ95747.1 FecR domain-containing protein [Chitinophaga horti]